MLDLTELDRGTDELPVRVVDNGDLRLAFLPTAGGRLISIQHGGRELLWRNPEYLDLGLATVRPRSTWTPLDGTMGSWANLGGSKTWPAPQGWDGPGQWAGPPDPVLDSGAWDVEQAWSEATRELTIVLRSPDDPRSGLRVEREFVVPDAGGSFRQRNTFVNVSSAPVRWSVWEVCQVDTEAFAALGPGPEAGLWIGASGEREPLSMVEAVGRIAVGEAVDGRRSVTIDDVLAKVGITDATGWLELRRPDGIGVRWDFAVGEGPYPDGGCQAEFWMQYPLPEPSEELQGLHPSARLVELEVLSPLVVLDPGESTSMDIAWQLLGP